jgi:hypothetical protein
MMKSHTLGVKYELESENPVILKLLDAGNKSLSMMGRLVTVASISVVVASFGTGEPTSSPLMIREFNRLVKAYISLAQPTVPTQCNSSSEKSKWNKTRDMLRY